MPKKIMMITDRQLYNLHKKLNGIHDRLEEIEKQLPAKGKTWLKFDECIPPASVCKEVNSMMDGLNTYTGFLGRLAEYYGCEPMGLYQDPTISPKYKALYRATMRSAYTRTPTVGKHTVLHEWFHHLASLKVVIVNKEDEEKYADKYADIFMSRMRVTQR